MSELTIYVAKVVGTMTSGLLTGLTVTSSFGMIPALLAGVPPNAAVENQHTLAKIWFRYSQGSAMVVAPGLPIIVISHLLAAYKCIHRPAPTQTILGSLTGISEPVQLCLAVLLVFLALPWTVIKMLPLYNRLGAAAKVQISADLKDDGKGIRDDLKAWEYLNRWRAVFFASGFIVGLLSL